MKGSRIFRGDTYFFHRQPQVSPQSTLSAATRLPYCLPCNYLGANRRSITQFKLRLHGSFPPFILPPVTMSSVVQALSFAQTCSRPSPGIRNQFAHAESNRAAIVPSNNQTAASFQCSRTQIAPYFAKSLAMTLLTDRQSARGQTFRAKCSVAPLGAGKSLDASLEESEGKAARGSETEGVILGIETSCDDTCAAVVSNTEQGDDKDLQFL